MDNATKTAYQYLVENRTNTRLHIQQKNYQGSFLQGVV